jgi:hypothetical protein
MDGEPLMSAITNTRSRVAVAARRHKKKPSEGTAEALATARKDLAAAKIEAYVARVIADSGPLTDEQRAKLAVVLAPIGVTVR